MMLAGYGKAAMTEAAEESPLEEIKEKIAEVIELLNQPYVPIVVNKDQTAEAVPSEETAT